MIHSKIKNGVMEDKIMDFEAKIKGGTSLSSKSPSTAGPNKSSGWSSLTLTILDIWSTLRNLDTWNLCWSYLTILVKGMETFSFEISFSRLKREECFSTSLDGASFFSSWSLCGISLFCNPSWTYLYFFDYF